MPSAIVFSRGRITLPRDVCHDLGIGPGSKVEFVENADGETIMRPVYEKLQSADPPLELGQSSILAE